MLYSQVGLRIRELRELHHYSREVLAERTDISAKFLYEIESGKKGFSADTLCRLAQALSVSCDYIMFGKTQEKYDAGKIACILEMLDSQQAEKMQEIVQALYEICTVL